MALHKSDRDFIKTVFSSPLLHGPLTQKTHTYAHVHLHARITLHLQTHTQRHTHRDTHTHTETCTHIKNALMRASIYNRMTVYYRISFHVFDRRTYPLTSVEPLSSDPLTEIRS